MSNPYTQPSITGYNATPPSDDGAKTTTNQVTWAKHKTKLADPIKTYAEGIDAAALAAFGLTLGAAVLTKTTDYTVTTSDRGRFFSVTGATTITLPAAATAGEGFPVLIVNTGSAVVTIDADSSETINGSVTVYLYPGEGALLTSSSTAWSGIVTEKQQIQKKVKTENTQRASTTSLSDDPHLAGFTLRADKHYALEAWLYYTQGGGDIQFLFSFSQPAQTGTEKASFWAVDESSNSFDDVDIDLKGSAVSITTFTDGLFAAVKITGCFQANATTGGTFSLQWAQNSSNVSATRVDQGSWVIITQLD